MPNKDFPIFDSFSDYEATGKLQMLDDFPAKAGRANAPALNESLCVEAVLHQCWQRLLDSAKN